jgi:hypothetical protein
MTKSVKEEIKDAHVPEHKKLGSLKIQFDDDCLSETFLNI